MLTYILIAAVAVLLCALCVCIGILFGRKKRENALRTAITESINSGEPMVYSLRDDRFSELENDVADLSALLVREKHNAKILIGENNAFLADISHQLKTPLAGIRLYCEIQQQAGHADIAAYSQKQLILLDRTDKLVSDLLRLEKLRAQAYTMDLQDEKLHELCRSVLSGLRVLYPNKNFSLSGEAVLRCDRTWLCEAIENIVKNACEHTREDGKIELEIFKGESSVFLTVQDNGGGLPEHERSRLFERFYRAPTATGSGTGLGLAVTKAIVEHHHGTIDAQNSRSGLRFTICFPAAAGIRKV